MREITIRPCDVIPLGHAGENAALTVKFDVTGWEDAYGLGTYSLAVKRPGESIAYLVDVTEDNGLVCWVVSNVDTGKAGTGSVQLRYSVGETLAKSAVYMTVIRPSVGDQETPDPYEDILEEIQGYADAAADSAQAAGDSAQDAEAWAVGERGGQAVQQSDETYHNNAKFYANQADTAKQSAEYFEGRAAQIQMSVEQIAQDVLLYKGAPLVADTAEAMTDHDRVYVYVGSETGYTAGNWYYWNGSAWTSGGVYNASAVQTDKTLTVADMAADSEATGDAVKGTRNAIDALNGDVSVGLTAFDDTIALNGATGEYVNGKLALYGTVGTSSRFLLCFGGQAKSKTSSQGFEQTLPAGTYSVHVKATNAPVGFTPQIAYTSTTFSNASYAEDGGVISSSAPIMVGVRITYLTNFGTEESPTLIEAVISCYEEKAGKAAVDALKETDAAISGMMAGKNALDYAKITANARLAVSDGSINSATNQSVSDYIPITAGQTFVTHTPLESSSYGGAFYDADKKLISTFTGDRMYYGIRDSLHTPITPANAAYVRYTYQNADISSGKADAWIVSAGTLTSATFPKKVLVLGDSIEYGVWTTQSGGKQTTIISGVGYIYKLADALNWVVENQAIRGIGYVAVGSFGSLSDALTAISALEDDAYDLVLVSLGINDYNTASVTIQAIKESAQNVISLLAAKFKSARVVFLTPYNCASKGNASTNFAYRYAYGGRTLKDVADAVMEVCTANGIECHDVTANFVLNNHNIETMLGDGVHPTKDGHNLIARGLVHLLA